MAKRWRRAGDERPQEGITGCEEQHRQGVLRGAGAGLADRLDRVAAGSRGDVVPLRAVRHGDSGADRGGGHHQPAAQRGLQEPVDSAGAHLPGAGADSVPAGGPALGHPHHAQEVREHRPQPDSEPPAGPGRAACAGGGGRGRGGADALSAGLVQVPRLPQHPGGVPRRHEPGL